MSRKEKKGEKRNLPDIQLSDYYLKQNPLYDRVFMPLRLTPHPPPPLVKVNDHVHGEKAQGSNE